MFKTLFCYDTIDNATSFDIQAIGRPPQAQAPRTPQGTPKALQGRPKDHQLPQRIPKGCPRTQMGPPSTSRGAKGLQKLSKVIERAV